MDWMNEDEREREREIRQRARREFEDKLLSANTADLMRYRDMINRELERRGVLAMDIK